VGTLLDTTVFIQIERGLAPDAHEDPIRAVSRRLMQALGPGEPVAMASITVSELLQGLHRAAPDRRARREAFIEALIEAFPPISFDLRSARAHARLWADLASSGTDIGAHDRIVAATALAHGMRVATHNVRHFEHVPGLEVVRLDPS
jgi:tRNA(fMet)-specific endonuclease VapC